jgi:hypothetical protein
LRLTYVCKAAKDDTQVIKGARTLGTLCEFGLGQLNGRNPVDGRPPSLNVNLPPDGRPDSTGQRARAFDPMQTFESEMFGSLGRCQLIGKSSA